ncbi:hypothetical protein KP509_06G050700 [Ceratopteris richardii]|uniref:Uncharacterized protein n=1 Tax=Ceratopteris richardii TaxID=49495 RepID=A0A8T2UP13_CERRI|nr:hypothetical protein KP509_06G050700 [Ceratopteris richardii]
MSLCRGRRCVAGGRVSRGTCVSRGGVCRQSQCVPGKRVSLEPGSCGESIYRGAVSFQSIVGTAVWRFLFPPFAEFSCSVLCFYNFASPRETICRAGGTPLSCFFKPPLPSIAEFLTAFMVKSFFSAAEYQSVAGPALRARFAFNLCFKKVFIVLFRPSPIIGDFDNIFNLALKIGGSFFAPSATCVGNDH